MYLHAYVATIVHLRSIDPRKLCIGVKYYIVHMYSVPHYTYGSTGNILVLEPMGLIFIYKERHCTKDQRGVGKF